MTIMRTAILTLALLATTLAPASAQILPEEARAIVPVVGSTAGGFGANFKTELQLHNPGSEPMRGTLVFHAAGRPGGPEDPRLRYELAAYETKHYADVVAQMGASGLGSMDIVPDTGSALPTAVFRAFDDQDESGTTGVTVPMVLVSKALGEGKTAALVVPSNLVRFRFNIGVRSLREGARLHLVLYEPDGSVAADLGERSYPGDYFLQQPAKEFLGVEPEADQSIGVTVVSGRAIVYGTTTDNKTNDGSVQLDEIFNAPPTIEDADGDGELLIVAQTSTGEPVTISVVAGDEDGDALTFAIGSGAAHGTLGEIVETEDGFRITYTPAPGFFGEDEFTITIGDGEEAITLTIRIIVSQPGNGIPTANAQTVTTEQGTAVTITLTGTDPDGDALGFAITAGPSNGSLSALSSTGDASASVIYTPNGSFSGTDSFEFSVDDGRGGVVRAVVTVVVVPVAGNRAPVATDQTVSTAFETAVGFTLLASDPDGDPLSYTVLTSPSNGTLSGTAPELSFTPAAGFSGTTSFTWSVSDGQEGSATATVTIVVASEGNQPPVASDQSVTTPEDTSVSVTLSASDPDGDALSYAIGTGPSNGTLSGTAPNLTYTPSANFNGTDSFTFTASDGAVPSNTATVTITVSAVNDAPVGAPDAYGTNEDTVLNVAAPGVLGNDSDVDGDTLTASVSATTTSGVLTLNGNGSFTYAPNADFNGSDSFTYTLSDGNGGTATAVGTITVTAVNDAPVASDAAVVTPEETMVDVVLGASDADGDALSYLVVTSPTNGSLSGVAPNLVYTPNSDFNGTDSFTFRASDGTASSNTATFTIQVTAVNDAPMAASQTVTTAEDTAVAVTLTGSDVDGDALSFTVTGGPTSGVLSGTAPNLTYTPNGNFNGSDSFTFTANDGITDSAAATVSITVTAVNDAPVAASQTVTTAEDTAVAVTLTGSDVDGDALSFAVTGGPTSGVLTGTAPNLTYTPNGNFNGSDSFTFTVNDGTTDSAPATVTVTVTAVNDTPVAMDDAYVVDEGAALNIAAPGVLGNDTDVEGTSLTAALVMNVTSGVLTLNTDGSFSYTHDGSETTSDSFTYTATDGVAVSNTATVMITINPVNDAPVVDLDADDSQGTTGSDFAVTFTENDPATLLEDPSDAIMTDSDSAMLQSLTVTLTNLLDPGAELLDANVGVTPITKSYDTTTDPGVGVLTLTGPATLAELESVLRTVTYRNTSEAPDTTPRSITFVANDGTDASAAATATVTIVAVNDAPVASDATFNVDENSANGTSVGAVTATDADGDALTYMITGGTGATAFAINGATGAITVADTAQLDFETTTSFTLTVEVTDDGTGTLSDTATITIDVNDLDEVPVFGSSATPSVAENTTAVVTVMATDPEGAAVTYSITGGADQALFSINAATGALSFNAAPDFEAPADADTNNVYLVEVTANDGTTSAVQNVSVTVTDEDEAPSFTSSATPGVAENTTAVITVTATDPEGTAITYSITGGADAALFTINGTTGALGFLAAPDFEAPADADANNVYLVDVTATDGANPVVQSLTVTVSDVDEMPLFSSSATPSVLENTTAVVTVVASDPEGAAVSYSITGGADQALFTINGTTGALTFLAAPDFEAPADADTNNVYLVDVTASDGTNPAVQSLSVTVSDEDEAPVFTSSATPSVAENTTAVVTVVASDPEGAAITYSITGGADQALFSINGTTGALTFLAAPDFEAPADGDTNNVYLVDVTATDGTSPVVQNLTVTVTDVNEAPAFTSSGTPSVAENTTAVVTVTTTDPEGDTVSYSITGGTDAALFAVGGTTGVLTFNAAPDFEAPADADTDNVYLVDVTADDGNGNTPVQSLSVTVTDADESPVFTSSATPSVAENTTAVVTVTAVDPEGAAVTYSITGGTDQALFAIDTNTGALSLLAAPDFETPADGDANNVYLVEVTATDGTMPAVQSLSVTVTDVNETPVFTSSATPSVAENTTAVVTVTTTDPEGDTMSYSITGGTDAALFSVNGTTGVLTFNAAPDFENPVDTDTNNVYLVEVTADDGNGNTPVESLTVTVTDVNEGPTITSAATATFNENATGTVLTVTATDPEGDTVTFTITGGADQGDLSIDTNTGAVTFNATPDYEAPVDADTDNFYVIEVTASSTGGTAVQTITIEVLDVNDPPAITSTATASFAENGVGTAHTVVANDPEGDTVTFSITGGADSGDLSIDPNTGAITFNVTPNFEAPADADTNNTYIIDVTATATGGTDVQTITITVTNVNEGPTITSGTTENVNENTTAVQTVVATDPDAGTTLTYSIVGGADELDFAINGSTGALTFNPAPNFEAPADSDANNVYVVTVRASDGALFDDETITVTVINVNEAPTAGADTYTALGNTQLRVAGATGTGVASTTNATGLLANDSDPDTIPAFNTLTTAVATGPANGTVTVNGDGSFTYISNAGFTGADNFTYTLSDGTNNVTGTINLTVSETVWYVHDVIDVTNNPATGDTGRSTNPFDSITELNGATTTVDDYIFIFRGNTGTTPHTGTIVLKSGQKLWGEGVGLTISPFGTIIAAGSQPRITAGADVVSVPATAASLTNVEIRGLDLSSTLGNAIDVTTTGANAASVTISNNTISGATAEGIDVNQGSTATTSTAVISNNTITSTGTAIDLSRTAGTLTVTAFSDNTVSGNSAGSGIVISNVTFDSNTTTGGFQQVDGNNLFVGASGNPVGLAGVSITSSQGNLYFDDLDIYAAVGTGLQLSGTGSGLTFSVLANSLGGTSTIDADNGAAVDITSVALDLRLGGLQSNTSTSGVSLNTVSGQFSAPSGSAITKSSGTGTAFNVQSSTATVTYGGNLNVTSGAGINVSNHSTGTVTFSGTTKTFSTGANTAINLATNGTATINITGGNLVISRTTGAGIAATGSGTLNITGSGNVINSGTSGAALTVSSVTIGSSGLTFQSISQNGGASGIVLSSTGTGNITVSGTGSAGSGGTIQNASGTGVSVNSVGGSLSLSYMTIQGSGDDGIGGSGLNGLTLTSVTLSSNGNAVGDSGIDLAQLTGSGGMSSCTVTGSAENNVRIANTSGTLTAFNVTNSSFTTTNFTTGNDGLLVENNGTGAMSLSITGSTFTDNKGDHFQVATNASATGSINFTFSNNVLSTTAANDPNVIGGGITISPSGSADVTFTMDNNNIQQAFDEGINLNLGTASTAAASLIGTVSNNIIGTAGDLDSGSESGTGISVVSNGAGYTRVAVTGNTVRQYANPYGILVMIKEGSSSMDATVTGNTVSNPGSFAINGIRVDAGATAGDSGTLCVTLTGNSVAGSGPGADTDIRLRQRFNTTIRLPGYGGASSDTTAVNAYVAGNNAGSDVSSAHNVGGGGGGFVGGSACPTP